MSKPVFARVSSVLLASACLGVVAVAPAHAIVATWDGGTTGGGTVWASPANWVGDVLPMDGDSILIANATVSTTNTTGIVTGAAGTAREMYLNNSLTGAGGGTPFAGTPPTKSFQSITFGTGDAATTRLPAGMFVYNGFNNTFTQGNTIRLTGDASGRVLNLDSGATNNGVNFSSGSYGVTVYEFAGASAALNTVNVASANSRFTMTAAVSGGNGMAKTGAGSVFMNNATNTIAGDFLINGGRLGFSNNGAFGTGSKTVRVADGANVALDNVGTTGDTVAATRAFELLGNSAGNFFVGASEAWTVLGAVGGTGSLSKAGTGAVNFNGPLTYTGTTTLTAGSAYFNSTLTSPTTVNARSGSTIGGLGTINGNVDVGGSILPGSSSTLGTLTVNGNVRLTDDQTLGTFRSGFSAVDDNKDVLNVSGSFDITAATLAITNLNAQNAAVQVIANYGTLVGGAFDSVTGLVGGYSLVYNYNGQKQIALVRGNTQLFYTGSGGTDLLTAGNFTTDSSGTVTATQFSTASADVTFGTANVNTGNLAATIPGTTYANSLTFSNPAATSITSATNTNNTVYTLNLRGTAINNPAGTGIVVTPGAGAVTINTNVTVLGNQSFTNNSTNPLAVTGTVALAANTLTLSGPGTTTLSGVVSGTGGLTKGGTGRAVVSGANTYTGTTTVTAGVLEVGPAAAGIILTGGTATPTPLGQGVDLQGGRLEFTYLDGSTIPSTVRALLVSGYNQPTKFGAGLIRSTTGSAAGYTIGYRDDGSRVSLRVTLPGDANLDGAVTFDDFALLQTNFATSGVSFAQGDFDYSGTVDFNDFALLQTRFGQTLPGGRAEFTREQYAAIMSITDASQVPEPAGLAAIGLAAAGLLRRRRTA